MRKTALLLASVTFAVLLASGVAMAFPADEVEPNDAINQAQNLDGYFSLDEDPNIVSSSTVPHATVNGSENGTRDYYSFTVNQAGVNTAGIFDVDGAMPTFDSYLWLYDASGNLLHGNDDNDLADPGSEHRYDSYIEYTFPRAGTYYIAVGNRSSSSGASSGIYRLHVSTQGAVTSDTPPPDTTPPDTALTQKPDAFSDNINPSFEFRASDINSTFQCKLDGGTYQSCASPKRYFLLSEGQHTFQVKATDTSGNTDQTPAEHTWTVDSFDPKIIFTERPGTATGPSRWDKWVTNDSTPTWAWDVQDANPEPGSVRCDLYDNTNDRDIVDYEPCSSPYAFEGELPDGNYEFEVETYDKADNWGYAYNEFEVDTVAPEVDVDSVKPAVRTGVSRSTNVVVTFDDHVYDSKQFVNIYKGASNTPLAVYRRYGDGDKKIEIDPKRDLKPGTTYLVRVTTGVNDGANNMEAPYSWNFKTKR